MWCPSTGREQDLQQPCRASQGWKLTRQRSEIPPLHNFDAVWLLSVSMCFCARAKNTDWISEHTEPKFQLEHFSFFFFQGTEKGVHFSFKTTTFGEITRVCWKEIYLLHTQNPRPLPHVPLSTWSTLGYGRRHCCTALLESWACRTKDYKRVCD